MENNLFNLNNKIYSNNNNIMLEIIKELNQLRNYSQDNLIISKLGNIINKINYIINENKKNLELIRNDISSLNQKFDKLNINNNIINKEIKYDNGRYVGQVVNGLKEGKGIFYWNDGDKYEGDWRNNKIEGKGIYYYKSGNRYEGDWRNDNREGKGIFYFPNGDRRMGDYSNETPIGIHALLTRNEEVKTVNY